MRITDIIRGVLDIVDRAEVPEPEMVIAVEPEANQDDAELVRMRQIAGLLGTGETEYSNSPEERVADVDAVIASGDDVHKSKHPSDLRADSISMFPNFQAKE
jgi:hypothetical protein